MKRILCRTSVVTACMAVAMLVAGALPALAQNTGTVRGTVTVAATGRPLSGARVTLVGTTRTGTSNESGAYSVSNVPVGTYTVRAAIIGYSSMETSVTVAAGQTLDVNFALNRAAISLNEIVVTGTAGAQEKRVIGNSVGAIQVGAELETAPIENVTELLTARTPGLTLMANSGQAGGASNIRIRGAGSVVGGYQPVFYVDGIRIESGLVTFSTNGTVQNSSALDFLNPQDIESIEVIKGPAAATLYGADAANGVIQIITKKGRRGDQSVQWASSLEFGQNEWTKSVGANTTYWRCTVANQSSNSFPGCQDPSSVQWWGRDADGNAQLKTGIPAEDIIDVGDGTFVLKDDPMFRHPAALRKGNTMDFNLSARGGTGNTGYFLSFNKNDEDGVFFNNFARRLGGRANFDINVSPDLDMSVQFSYNRTQVRQPLNNNASNSINRNAMRGRARASADPWEPGYRGFNPWLSNEYNEQARTERMTIGLTTNWQPVDWFRNRVTLGLDRQDWRQTTFYTLDTTGQAPWGTTAATGSIDHNLPNVHRWTLDYAGSVVFDVNDNLNSTFSGGMQLNARTYRSFLASADGFVANNLNLVGSGAVRNANESLSEQTSLGFFLQEQVGWRDKMFVTGAVRFDDNSAFGSDFSLVVYPKASLSWMISEEDFFNIGLFDQLKLRFAWGRAGNAPAPFSADRTFTTGQGVSGDAIVNTLTISSYGNPNLKAETGQEWETGFDASILDGRAGVEFTVYNKQTKDALISVPDPGSTGFTGSHLINVGQVDNKGVELLLTASPVLTRNFGWDASLAVSGNKNRLVSFGRLANGEPTLNELVFGAFADVQRHREGYPLGGFWAVDVERDAAGQPVLDGSGNVNVLNNCRWAPTDPTWNQETDCDDIYMGPSRPTREAALTNTFTLFGNLRIFSQFDYRGGHYQWCAICSINSRIDLNTWDVNTGGTPLNPDVTDADVVALKSLQTKSHITKADFIKFRELSLSYTFPESWTRVLPGAQRWALTLSGRNLAVWTKYKGRGDPEVSFYSDADFTLLDYASTPQTRRLTGSLRVTF